MLPYKIVVVNNFLKKSKKGDFNSQPGWQEIKKFFST